MQARAWFLRVARCLNQSQLRRMDACKNPLNARGFQPEHALEQPGEHGTIVGQNRIVAVLKKVCLLDLDLFAEDTAAIDAAAQYPVDAAMAVIGAAVAVLPKGAAKFGDHDHHRIAPSRRSNLFGKPASARPSSPRRSARYPVAAPSFTLVSQPPTSPKP